jgi:hypothetical protein
MKNPPKRIGIFLGDAGDAFPGASNLLDIFGYMIYGLQIVRGPRASAKHQTIIFSE